MTELWELVNIMLVWEYEGEPTTEELIQRVELGNHQLGYRHTCPNCSSGNTNFLRNSYWMCHSCIIWFTTQDAVGYYDTAAYKAGEMVEQVILDELEENNE